MTGRRPGPSVRLRLALSYAGVVVLTGALLLAVVWLFLLRYVPSDPVGTVSGVFPARRDLVRAFAPPAALALGGLLVIGVVGGWFLAGRVLAPLARITEATRRVADGTLSHRIGLPGRADEFRTLADAFDGMVARVETHVEAQRRFAANASHELRTPLAITRSVLEVAERDPRGDPSAVIARLRTVNTRAIELTEALLLLSRADQGPLDPEPVDLSLLAEEAAETLLSLADARGVVLDVDGSVATARGSVPLLLQLVTNLVHNGIVHNLGSAPGDPDQPGRVRVHTRDDHGEAVLEVENTGVVVPATVVPTLTEAFQRGSARQRGDHGGTGLGLAIVDAVVRAHGGSLRLRARDGGGLVVTVRLPTH
jgi:two-component system sensor histidine kinase VanS